MIKAVIFDMDGLMVDSEPFWHQAQLEVFPEYGVNITRQDCVNTTGVRIDNIVEQYYQQSPWQGATQEEVCDKISNRVIELVKQHKPAMPGLRQLLSILAETELKLAVASSSPMKLIQATLEALELTETFEAVQSAEHLKYAKPHPEVYINTADALGVSPTQCLALEDSFAGLLAAKSARMKTIIVPEVAEQAHWVIADKQLSSLEEVSLDMISGL